VVAAECGPCGAWSLVGFDLSRGGGEAPLRVELRGSERLGEPVEVAPCPVGSSVAVATHDLRLLLVEPFQGVARRVDAAQHEGGVFDLAWSADGRWLAYAVSTGPGGRTSAIRVARPGSGSSAAYSGPIEVTDGAFRDTCPRWDPSGRYLAFLSSRALRATEDQLFWQLNFARAQRPYLCLLTASAADPMRPPPRRPGWDLEDEQGEEEEEEEGEEVPEVVVEAEGLARRTYAVPVPARRMGQLEVLYDDVLLYTALPDGGDPTAGAAAETDAEAEEAGALIRVDLASG